MFYLKLQDQQLYHVDFIPVQNGFCWPFFRRAAQMFSGRALLLTRSLTILITAGVRTDSLCPLRANENVRNLTSEVQFLKSTYLHSLSPGLSWSRNNGQFPVGLISQLVEHCTGIAEVCVGFPFESEFFIPLCRYCLSDPHIWEDD